MQHLVREHLGLVRAVVAQIRAAYQLSFANDDLIALGNFGLVQAAKRYQPNRGSFRAFAYSRIRGAILDGLPGLCPAHCRLEPRARRAPLGSLASKDEPADLRAERLEREREVHRALAALPDRDSLVLKRRYWDQCTLVSISRELGVSKSRATRIHATALRRLRSELERQGVVSDAETEPGVAGENGASSQVVAMSSLVSS